MRSISSFGNSSIRRFGTQITWKNSFLIDELGIDGGLKRFENGKCDITLLSSFGVVRVCGSDTFDDLLCSVKC